MKRLFPFAVAFLAGILLACAGSVTHQPTPGTPGTPSPHFGLATRATSIPGVGTHLSFGAATKAQNFDWSLEPKAFAQAPAATLVVTGPSNGFCTSQPAVEIANPTFFYPMYGAGQINDPTCVHLTATGSDKAGLVAGLNEGMDIAGDGILQGFRVKYGSGLGQGITAEVWVQRSRTAIQTPVTCTIPATTVSGEAKCTDTTNTFAVLDGDKVIILLSGSAGDTYQDIRWLLGKN